MKFEPHEKPWWIEPRMGTSPNFAGVHVWWIRGSTRFYKSFLSKEAARYFIAYFKKYEMADLERELRGIYSGEENSWRTEKG